MGRLQAALVDPYASLRPTFTSESAPMSRFFRLPEFGVLAAAQVALAIIGSCAWFYVRTTAYLAGPPDPDTYAQNWGFQLIVFAIVWLPAILLSIGIVLAIERAILIPYYRSRPSQGDRLTH